MSFLWRNDSSGGMTQACWRASATSIHEPMFESFILLIHTFPPLLQHAGGPMQAPDIHARCRGCVCTGHGAFDKVKQAMRCGLQQSLVNESTHLNHGCGHLTSMLAAEAVYAQAMVCLTRSSKLSNVASNKVSCE